MGLPIFREPVATQESTVTSKPDPTAHGRSTIRRQRTIRSPRRQDEIIFSSSSARRLDNSHRVNEPSASLQPLIGRSSSARRPTRHTRPPSVRPSSSRPYASISTGHGTGDVSIHLSDDAWREAVGSMSTGETRWQPPFVPLDSLRASPDPISDTRPSIRPLFANQLLSSSDRTVEAARPRSRRGFPDDIARQSVAANAYIRRMEWERDLDRHRQQQTSSQTSAQHRDLSLPSQAYRHEVDSLPRLSRVTAREHVSEQPEAYERSSISQRRTLPWETRLVSGPDDDHWEQMLSTITPDPYLPSHDSSFTSAAVSATSAASGSTTNVADSSNTSLTVPSSGQHGDVAQDECDDLDAEMLHYPRNPYYLSDSTSEADSLDERLDALFPPPAPDAPDAFPLEHFPSSHAQIATSSTPDNHTSQVPRTRSASPSAGTTAPTRLHDAAASDRRSRRASPSVSSFGYSVQTSLRANQRSRNSHRTSARNADRQHRSSSHLSEIIIPGTSSGNHEILESLSELTSRLSYHLRQFERRHQPNVHDEDAVAERDRMREVLEMLVQRDDLGNEWWHSVGLDRTQRAD